jgi:hypothetical protein
VHGSVLHPPPLGVPPTVEVVETPQIRLERNEKRRVCGMVCGFAAATCPP